MIARLMTVAVRNPRHGWDHVRKLFRRPAVSSSVAYEATEDWRTELHSQLGCVYPCPLTVDFAEVWDQLGSEVCVDQQLGQNLDADPALAECLWCIVGHTNPRSVVETGVARGVSSRIVIESLRRHGEGHLWSVDLPPLRDPWWTQAATAVPQTLRASWTYVRGDSMRVLPKVLRQASPVDLFLHDSVHDDRYMAFELTQALRVLQPGGFLIVDDVNATRVFGDLASSGAISHSWVCSHEAKNGFFGIAVKA